MYNHQHQEATKQSLKSQKKDLSSAAVNLMKVYLPIHWKYPQQRFSDFTSIIYSPQNKIFTKITTQLHWLLILGDRRIRKVKLICLENHQAGKDLASVLVPQLLGEPGECVFIIPIAYVEARESLCCLVLHIERSSLFMKPLCHDEVVEFNSHTV